MKRKTVLLADAGELSAVTLREMLEGTGDFAVTLVRDGRAALREARLHPPELLILDLALPQLDGLAVLRGLCREGIELPVVLVSAFVSERVLMEAAELRADYFLPKPFAPESLLERLHALSAPPRYDELRPPALAAVAILHELGFSPGHHGYRYAIDGADLLRAEPTLVHALTKAVYPSIARRHGTTAACVERSLRRAVEQARLRGSAAAWRRYFPQLEDSERPSNGLFLATLAEAARGERVG